MSFDTFITSNPPSSEGVLATFPEDKLQSRFANSPPNVPPNPPPKILITPQTAYNYGGGFFESFGGLFTNRDL